MNKQHVWTKNDIQTLHDFASNYTIDDLMKIFPGCSYHAIHSKLYKEKIKIKHNTSNILQNYNLQFHNLSNFEQQLILGSLAGDGSVYFRSNSCVNCVFCEEHKEKEENYCQWKYEYLKNTFKGSKGYRSCKNEKLGNPNEPKWYFRTRQHPIFTYLNKLMYKNIFIKGSKQRFESHKYFLPFDLYKNLDLLGLLIWYLDDGNLSQCSSKISVTGWDINDLNQIINHLNITFNLNLKLKQTKRKKKTRFDKDIKINAQDRDFLLPIWQKMFEKYDIPKCMLRKIVLPNYFKSRVWSKKDTILLLQNINLQSKEIHKIFPNRTIVSIENKKNRLKKEVINVN